MQLKRRILTAALLIPPVVAAVLWLPSLLLAALLAVFLALGAWEWSGLMGWRAPALRLLYVALLLAVAGLLLFLLPSGDVVLAVLGGAVVFWCLALLRVAAFQRGAVPGAASRWAGALGGLLLLVPAWFAVLVIHGAGPWGPVLALVLLLLVWAADIGAYFAGRRFGRRRLADRVSPGKTWEGLAGGLVAAVVVGLGASWVLGLGDWRLPSFLAVSIVTVLFSVLGDLVESMVKRRAGVKDSGGLLPGHGGILDRIDSLTAAAPVFALGLLVLGMGE